MSRFLRISLYLVLLAGLIWYGRTRDPRVTLAMCLAEPEKYHGTRIEVANETIVQQLFNDGFTIRYLGKTVTVIGDPTGLRPNEFLSMIAVFDRSGRLLLEKKHLALYRRWKIWVSVPPVLLFLIFFLRRYRLDLSTLQWQEADRA
ncbi:MAG TPA: hypothetical protein PK843_17170 [bacterium]|nr:hypothetical protein [bacterium]HPN36241.1 hypothetical protein [bacterium]